MNTSSYQYIDKLLVPVLAKYGFDQLDQFWDINIEWFEEPNFRRGGWSGVGSLKLDKDLVLFVKKQQHYSRRSWSHPWNGEPTFRREFHRLIELAKANILAPRVVGYAEWMHAGEQRAILVTEKLNGFIDLQTLLLQFHEWSRSSKIELLRQVAIQVRRLHDLGLMHRALYPKHVFVHSSDNFAVNFDIAFIDLEKARYSLGASRRMIIDLSSLHRRLTNFSRSYSLSFYKYYLGRNRLSPFTRWCLKRLLRRSLR